LVYQAESSVKENEAKIPEELKTSIAEKTKTLKDILAKEITDFNIDENTNLMKQGIEDLSHTISEIGKHVYQDPKAEAASPETPPEEAKPEGENIQDTNFEEK
jgi:molecular chaperone DnaK (HSP70)